MVSPRVWIPALILACFSGAGYAAWRISGLCSDEPSWREEQQLGRLAGLPLTAEELRRQTAVPDAQNAARLLSSSLVTFDHNKNADSKTIFDLALEERYGLTKIQLQALETTLAALQPHLAKVEQASRLERLDFRRQWEKGFDLEMPEYGPIHSMARTLSFRAKQRSDSRGALQDVRTIFRLSKLLAQDPTAIAGMRSTTLSIVGLTTLQHLCSRRAHDGRFLAAAKAVAQEVPYPDPKHAVKGELLLGLAFFDTIASNPDTTLITGEAVSGGCLVAMLPMVKFNNVKNAYKAKYLRQVRLIYEQLPDDPQDVKQVVASSRAADQRISEDKSLIGRFLSGQLPIGFLSSISIRSLQAQQRITIAGIDLLAGQEPILPADPFSGKKMRLLKKWNGFVLYSVGRDEKDDDGKTRPDIAWHYPPEPPEKRPATL